MTATAAPMATPDPDPELELLVLTAEPSPVAEPVVALEEASMNRPCALMTMPDGIVACAVELDTLTAMAAATEIGVPLEELPSEAEAEGAAGLEPSVPAGASEPA